MSRVTDILVRARDILADTDSQRYSDDALIRIFNEGASSLALSTRMLTTMSAIELQDNVSRYSVSNAIDILKVQYKSRRLESRTEQEMNNIDPDWEEVNGDTPEFVIFDNLPKNTFKIYPFLQTVDPIETTYNSLYGALIDINVDNDLLYPVYSDLGVGDYLFIAYKKKADTITIATIDDDFEFDSICDEAFVLYISGMALRNDADTLNRQFGAEQLSLYGQYVKQYLSKDVNEYSKVTNNSVNYVGFQ